MNKFTINNCKHAKELIKLDWPENLLIGPDDCETYLKHCETYNMKFLKGSYGTIVHKQFNKYFKYISSRNDKEYEIQQKLTCGNGLEGNYKVKGVNLDLDHVNLFQSKKYKDVYMVTSSPYNRLQTDGIKDYPYGAYIIHPNFLDYHGHPFLIYHKFQIIFLLFVYQILIFFLLKYLFLYLHLCYHSLSFYYFCFSYDSI